MMCGRAESDASGHWSAFFWWVSLQDQEQLSELARLVFEEEDSPDVRELANEVKSRESASPLAIVIADIVLDSFMSNKKQSMLGAIFGAYAALGSGSIEHACIGAIAGAITMNVSIFMPIDTIQLGEGFS